MLKGNQLSVNIRINENSGKIIDQCKQCVTLSHKIGEGQWWSSGQPSPFITFCQVLKNSS